MKIIRKLITATVLLSLILLPQLQIKAIGKYQTKGVVIAETTEQLRQPEKYLFGIVTSNK